MSLYIYINSQRKAERFLKVPRSQGNNLVVGLLGSHLSKDLLKKMPSLVTCFHWGGSLTLGVYFHGCGREYTVIPLHRAVSGAQNCSWQGGNTRQAQAIIVPVPGEGDTVLRQWELGTPVPSGVCGSVWLCRGRC